MQIYAVSITIRIVVSHWKLLDEKHYMCIRFLVGNNSVLLLLVLVFYCLFFFKCITVIFTLYAAFLTAWFYAFGIDMEI